MLIMVDRMIVKVQGFTPYLPYFSHLTAVLIMGDSISSYSQDKAWYWASIWYFIIWKRKGQNALQNGV